MRLFLFCSAILLLSIGCKRELSAEEKLNLAAEQFGDSFYNTEDVDHLVFLYEYANKNDKEVMHYILDAAKQGERGGRTTFAENDYIESLYFYPSIDALISIANGALKKAQYHIQKPDYNLQTTLMGRTIASFYEQAIFYYDLASDFGDKTDQALSPKIKAEIAKTKQCIDDALEGKYKIIIDHGPKRALCRVIYYPDFTL